jgi:hypothetical protein
VFLDETWLYANDSESRMLSEVISQSFNTMKPTTSTKYIILHARRQNEFVSVMSLIFVPGMKLGDYHNSINEDNFGRWILTSAKFRRTVIYQNRQCSLSQYPGGTSNTELGERMR